jgi:hypothetical protein
MNLDIGEILSRAFQITWRHKILWVFSALPVLLGFLFFPVMFVPIFFMDGSSFNNPFFIEEPVYIVLFIVFSIFISLLSYILYGISSSSVILGVIHAEEGVERFTFNELIKNSKRYWVRVLGVLLLIGIGVSLVVLVIFGCMVLFGVLTAGIGFICIQPLFLLIYPLMLVMYGIIELSQVAVVVDNIGVTDAIKRGWELVRANFWRIVLISLIVYLGISFLSSILMFPLMTPFFFIPFFVEGGRAEFNPRTMILFMGGLGLLVIPVMAFIQGITITFLKSTYTLVYLRLTKQQDINAVVLETTE